MQSLRNIPSLHNEGNNHFTERKGHLTKCTFIQIYSLRIHTRTKHNYMLLCWKVGVGKSDKDSGEFRGRAQLHFPNVTRTRRVNLGWPESWACWAVPTTPSYWPVSSSLLCITQSLLMIIKVLPPPLPVKNVTCHTCIIYVEWLHLTL